MKFEGHKCINLHEKLEFFEFMNLYPGNFVKTQILIYDYLTKNKRPNILQGMIEVGSTVMTRVSQLVAEEISHQAGKGLKIWMKPR